VKSKVASGLYNNASEVVREAAIGLAQLEAGQTFEVESEQHFIDLVRSKA
jgi:Arc/MetJ-type ribon-helix-helix transcriptional regulator